MPGVWHGAGLDRRRWAITKATAEARDLAAGEPCRLKIPGVCIGAEGPRHAHHVNGSATADPYDPEGVWTTCGPCNLHVGDPTRHTDEGTPLPPWLAARVREEPG